MKSIVLALLLAFALAAPVEDLVNPQAFRDFKIPYAGKMYSLSTNHKVLRISAHHERQSIPLLLFPSL